MEANIVQTKLLLIYDSLLSINIKKYGSFSGNNYMTNKLSGIGKTL